VADRDNRVVTYVTDTEKARLDEWAADTDKSVSHLLREAVLEYLDHDRTARVEDRLDAIDETLSELAEQVSAETTHTHKAESGMNKATEATEKARAMVRRLHANHGDVIRDRDVDMAIEDIAGVDDRTKRKYRDLFRRRGYLFEHPGDSPVWTTEAEQWTNWIEDYARLNGADAAREVADDYPADIRVTAEGTHLEVHESAKENL